VFVTNMGQDSVGQYRLDLSTGLLMPNSFSPAFFLPRNSGPRHLQIHPRRNVVYVVGETDSNVRVVVFDRDRGILMSIIQTISTLPPGVDPGDNLPAELVLHPSTSSLYVTNRGHDSITAYACDMETGLLRYVSNTATRGMWPRHMAVFDDMAIVGNERSNTVATFHLEENFTKFVWTGTLLNGVPSPQCLLLIENEK